MKEYDFDIFDYFKPPFKNKVIGLAFNYLLFALLVPNEDLKF